MLACGNEILNQIRSQILTHTTVGLIEKGLLFLRKMLVCGWNLPCLEVNARPKKRSLVSGNRLGEKIVYHLPARIAESLSEDIFFVSKKQKTKQKQTHTHAHAHTHTHTKQRETKEASGRILNP